MIQDFLLPFLAVGLAELGDKTQLAIFCLASKTEKYVQLLIGVILAFMITDGLAIILGDFITKLVPMNYVRVISGIIFIVFGILFLVNNKAENSSCVLRNPFISGFGLIFISEMGDKTQIASGLFATQYRPLFVFIGVILALSILSIIAVYLGKIVSVKINKRTITKIAGILFLLIGVSCTLF